jgi:hypothetical protein
VTVANGNILEISLINNAWEVTLPSGKWGLNRNTLVTSFPDDQSDYWEAVDAVNYVDFRINMFTGDKATPLTGVLEEILAAEERGWPPSDIDLPF